MSPRAKRWSGVAVAAAAAAVAVVGTAVAPGPAADVPVWEARRAPFALRVSAEGHLRAVRATPLNVPVEAEGPLRIAWLAADGSRVRAGDVVVRFDATKMEEELAAASSDLATAELEIRRERRRSRGELANLERDADLAARELEQAETFQSRDESLYSRSEILESRIDKELAAERREHAAAAAAGRQRLRRADLDLLAIDKRRAETRRRQARRGLAALEITAPHDGILVLKRNWRGEVPRVGEDVWNNGQPLAEIPDLSRMEAEVYVLEADAGGLAVGQRARLELEAHPAAAVDARVARVDSLAKPRYRDSPVQYFAVTLELERTDPERMKPGQRARAEIFLDEREDALAVPRQAVFEEGGRSVVWRRRGGGFEAVAVTLGPSALGRVVVEEGLEEGDVLALRHPRRQAGAAAGRPATPGALLGGEGEAPGGPR